MNERGMSVLVEEVIELSNTFIVDSESASICCQCVKNSVQLNRMITILSFIHINVSSHNYYVHREDHH